MEAITAVAPQEREESAVPRHVHRGDILFFLNISCENVQLRRLNFHSKNY